jgi:hypothetical protein
MSNSFKDSNPFKKLKKIKEKRAAQNVLRQKDQNIKDEAEFDDIWFQEEKPRNKNDPISYEELQNNSEFWIKIWYKDYRKHIETVPYYLRELKDIVCDNMISSEWVPLSHDEFDLYFYDVANDKWYLETDEDLRSAYRVLCYCNPKCLKVVVQIRRGGRTRGRTKGRCYNSELFMQRFNEVFSKKRESSCSSSSDEEDEKLDEVFKLYQPEETRQMIIREGLTYQWERKMGGGTATYMCEEFYNNRWTGRWKVNTLALGGEYGHLAIKHSLAYEDHACIREKESVKKFAQASSSYIGGENMVFTRDEVKSVTRALIKRDPNMTPAQILTHIKSVVPQAEMPTRKEIGTIISTERDMLIPNLGGPGLFDLQKIQTLRKTPFARGVAFTMVDSKPRHFLFLHSDFQEKVIAEVAAQPHPHLFIDGTFKCCPRQWHQLLNIAVYHREKKLYIPVAHICMQTKKYEGYLVAMKWVKDNLNINPEFVTTDFETALMDATKKIYPNADLVPWFFHFVKWLWMNAAQWGLRKKFYLKDTKQLIFSLKALAFRPPDKIFRRFEQLKIKYAQKNSSFMKFFEYFEHTWMDGIFKIKDWNYYDKIEKFEELAITNNGLESFHQMIKSQLRRTTPSFTGFIEVLGRVETLRKCDYDEDRISGDPQYNRWWPATRIMKELYCKEISNRKKSKKEDKNEPVVEDDENEFPSYVDYQGNPKDPSEKNRVEYLKLEREVNLLFEEFEEDNNSFQRDSRKRKAEKAWRELEQEKNKMPKLEEKDEDTKPDLFEDFVITDRPALLEDIEKVKNLKIETNEKNKEFDDEILNNEEFKYDIDRILSKRIEKKAKRRQQRERNMFI